MGFFAVSFVVDIESRRDEKLLFAYINASMELILIPNCSLIQLHSNDKKSLKSLFLNNITAINIIFY